jgi:serine/threonine protein kinase/tetratricopeptide (TPR) repeat protein
MKPEPISVDSPSLRDETAEVMAQGGSYLRQPTQIGPYKIIKVIGRGGMGTVYKAQVVVSCEVPIGQDVAIKLLRETEEKERLRFAREAGYLQALRHPGIVRVLDAGEYEGQPYLVMQLVDGGHADDLLVPGKPLEEQRVADLAIQALEALQVAHLSGILHRDIKPGNIMITAAGQVKLVDFGLAQYMDAESHLTATGAVVGTPAYMSPEQAAGRRTEVGRRSDVYSMGACLYELLTGQQPFTADNSVALLRRIIEEPLIPPSRLRKDLHHDLETIVLKAMAKDFRDRYASAEAMAADLRRFRLGVKVRTGRPGQLLPFLRSAWHHRSTIAALGLLLFVSASLATLMVVQGLKRAKAQNSTGNPVAVTQEAPPEADPTPSDPWVPTFHQIEALDSPQSALKIKAAPTFGKDAMRTETIKRVSGSVRLSVNIELRDATFLVELMINDRDIGRGYRLRLIGSKDNDRLELLREKRLVTSRDLGQLARGQTMRMTIERNDNTITGSIGKREPLRLPDLVPIEGESAAGVYIAFVPGEVRVSDVQLDRQRSTLFISALELADNERQENNFGLAKEKYEEFLHDHPQSPQARDAQLRIGLCLEAMDNPLAYEQALNTFIEVASANRDDPRYVLTATVHAWSCALRLGRYEEAEEFFDAVRRDNDLSTVLATVSEAMIQDLVKDYVTRANTIANAEPERAVKLYTNGAEIATYLKQNDAAGLAEAAAGDILMSLNRSNEALERYRTVSSNMQLPMTLRMKALLKVAEAERMRDHLEAAEIAYQMILSHNTPIEDYQSQARLWLGDIYAQRGDISGANACWSKSTDEKSLAGIIMHRMLTADTPMPTGDDRFHANDIEYFNARLALMRGHPEQFLERLQHVVDMGPANDWPSPFAQHLLQVLQSGRSEADVEPHAAPTPADAADASQPTPPTAQPQAAP